MRLESLIVSALTLLIAAHAASASPGYEHTRLVSVGDVAPDSGGLTFTVLRKPSINDDGDVAFAS